MQARLLEYLAAALVVLGALAGIYFKGRAAGQAQVQAKWDAANSRAAVAQKLADEAQQKRFDDQAAAHKTHNIEVSNDHQKAIDALFADLVRARADVRAAGGLRIPAAVCAGATEGTAKTGGDSGHDADVAGTVALPERIEVDLLNLAAEADRITEIARSCQAWVRKQGFYQ